MKADERNFAHRVLVASGIAALVAAALLVLVSARDVFLVIFAGILLAIFIRGISDGVSHYTGLPTRVALTLVLLMLGLLVVAVGWLLAAEVSGQLEQLGRELGSSCRRLREQLGNTTLGRQILSLLTLPPALAAGNTDLAAQAARAFSSTLGAVVSFFIALFIGLYLAVDPAWYRRGLLRIVPPQRRQRAAQILDAIGHTLRWWLIGRFAGMVVVGLATTIGLWLLGMPLALALGAIAFLLDFVPFLGPIVAAVPAVLVALAMGPTQALYVALLYVGIQAAEGYVLTPLIEQRSVSLPPALTISAQVLMGVTAGALGVLLATPLAAVAVTVVRKLYVEDTLKDDIDSQ